MLSVKDIYDKIRTFLSNNGNYSKNELGKFPEHDECPTTDVGENLENRLLKVACMGNPEKTIQGELLHYLRDIGLDAVSEFRFFRENEDNDDAEAIGLSIDIMVLDEDSNPACAIELKHYSRHQGSFMPLKDNLEIDHIRLNAIREEGIPVIQVGFYTEVRNIIKNNVPNDTFREAIKNYRFLSAYALDDKNALKIRPANLRFQTSLEALHQWINTCYPLANVVSFEQAFSPFGIGDITVLGRVHFVAGLCQ